VAGTVVAINTELLSRPELINHDSYGAGWLIELKPDSMDDVDELMDADEYEASLPEEEEE
jgi:glycine cleavage system H protein